MTFAARFNLEEDKVGAVLFGDFQTIREGDIVKRTGRIMQVPVGEALVGRVVDVLGNPIDDAGPIVTEHYYPVERIAPGVVDRQPVKEPLQTGLKALDAMVPIGRVQPSYIGDRNANAVAVDPHQPKRQDSLHYAHRPKGFDSGPVVKHADFDRWTTARDQSARSDPAASSFSRLLRRRDGGVFRTRQACSAIYTPSNRRRRSRESRFAAPAAGREAYPGDVFYLHSRLLERPPTFEANCGVHLDCRLSKPCCDISAYIQRT